MTPPTRRRPLGQGPTPPPAPSAEAAPEHAHHPTPTTDPAQQPSAAPAPPAGPDTAPTTGPGAEEESAARAVLPGTGEELGEPANVVRAGEAEAAPADVGPATGVAPAAERAVLPAVEEESAEPAAAEPVAAWDRSPAGRGAPAPEAGVGPVEPAREPAGAVTATEAGRAAPPAAAARGESVLPAPAEGSAEADDGRFRVVLENFEGPFDLLLQLISRHKLDVTEVALSRVTDDFLAHLRAMGPDGDLDQTTEFLVVAATLLDLKAARLLPTAEVEDEADLALLEARDLLFARLLQYRAFKRVAEIFADRLAAEAARHPRTVGLEPHHAELLPDVVISIGPEGFARLAVKAMRPKPKPEVYVDHIHAPLVSVREQAAVVVDRLRAAGALTFAELTGDAPDTLTVVARFLALLELYRERAVALEQDEALGPLLVRWSGAEPGRALVSDEFDQAAGAAGGEEGTG